ncbi:MAG TPA: hypothetical protein VG734_03210 [Lacunisphaera sp.]|nr:hypothetical protein [Lacunisphaera sp.]
MTSLLPDDATELLSRLTALQVQVARRADELVKAGASSTELKLACWLQAEHEILDQDLLAIALEARAAQPGNPFPRPG